MKKIYLKILITIFIIVGSVSMSFANEGEATDYNETKKSIDSYIDTQLEKIDANIMQIKKELSDTSFIQFGRKSELNSKLSDCIDEKNRIEENAQKIQQRINVVEDIIGPINRMVEEYKAKLYSVVKKFEFSIN